MPKAKTTKPGTITLRDGTRYRAIVLRIFDRDEKGRPKQCMIVHDDATVHLLGGEEFMIIYAPEDMLAAGN